ncbi:MAG: hypothetical protein WC986_14735 [Elusimicrobiota bacterium]
MDSLVTLRRALWTSSGRRYLAGETMRVVGEFQGKFDLDGPQGKLYRVPVDAVGWPTRSGPPRVEVLPPKRVPIGSLNLP